MSKSSSSTKTGSNKIKHKGRASIGAIYSAEQEAREKAILLNIKKAKTLQAILLHQKIEERFEAKESILLDLVSSMWAKNNHLMNKLDSVNYGKIKLNYYVNTIERLNDEQLDAKEFRKALENVKCNLEFIISIIYKNQARLIVQGIDTNSVSTLNDLLTEGQTWAENILNDTVTSRLASLSQEIQNLRHKMKNSEDIKFKFDGLKEEIKSTDEAIESLRIKCNHVSSPTEA